MNWKKWSILKTGSSTVKMAHCPEKRKYWRLNYSYINYTYVVRIQPKRVSFALKKLDFPKHVKLLSST